VLSYHSGKVVAEVSTDANGAFAFPLNPGRYIIVPGDLLTSQFCHFRTPEPFEVTVRPREIIGAGFTYIEHCISVN